MLYRMSECVTRVGFVSWLHSSVGDRSKRTARRGESWFRNSCFFFLTVDCSPLNTKMTLGAGKIQVINADLGNTFPRTVATSENSDGLLCCWAGW